MMNRPWIVLIFLAMVYTGKLAGQSYVLNVDQPPALKAHAGDDLKIYYLQGVRLGANPAASYGYGNYTFLWEPAKLFADPTQENPLVYPEKTTTFTLTVSDGNHCIARDQVTITISGTGVEENTQQPGLHLYPNPTDGVLNIEISGYTGRCQLLVTDIHGRVVQQSTLVMSGIQTAQLDIGDLPSGLYFIRMLSDLSTITQRFILR